MNRSKAREAILDAANQYRLRLGRRTGTYTQRHLTQAVCVARRHLLVDGSTLIAAGFRPQERA